MVAVLTNASKTAEDFFESAKPYAISWIEQLLVQQAFVGTYHIVKSAVGDRFHWELPFEIPHPEIFNEANALNAATWAFSYFLPERLKGPYPQYIWVAFATIRAVQWLFFKEKPPIPSFIKAAKIEKKAVDEKDKDKENEMEKYLAPLKEMKEGKVNYVFAQTGMSLGLFAKKVAELFPKKETYWIEGRVESQEKLKEFLHNHPKCVLISRQKGVLGDLELPKGVTFCEAFSYEGQVYVDGTREGRIELKDLQKDVCIAECGGKDEGLAGEIFDFVQNFDKQEETAGLVSVDGWMQMPQRGESREEAFRAIFDTLRKTLHPDRLIPLCRQMGIEYTPRQVHTPPRCLSQIRKGPCTSGEAKAIQEKLEAKELPYHVRVTGKSFAELQILLGSSKKPLFALDTHALSKQDQLGLLLDYLYCHRKVILAVPSGMPESFLGLIPPETQIAMCLSEPLKKPDGLEGWFTDFNFSPQPAPAQNPFSTALPVNQTTTKT